MRRHRLAIIGYGRLGQACARVIAADETATLAAVVRRPVLAGTHLPSPFERVPVLGHSGELSAVDAALICVPTDLAADAARELLQHQVPVVDCASLHGEALLAHKARLERYAVHFHTPAIVGAGWDPGLLSLQRALFALLSPKGHTETLHRPGINLHHSTLAGAVPGVRSALATEVRGADGRRQNYFYLELEAGAQLAAVEQALRADPLFAGEEVLVFALEDIAEAEAAGHGVTLERHGAGPEHPHLLFEARGSEYALSAQVMLAASRALPACGHHACTLQDLPLGALWGERRQGAEQMWG